MKTFCLTEAKVSVTKPYLYHQPRDALDGPFVGSYSTEKRNHQYLDMNPPKRREPKLCSVNRSPEKQIAAIPIKNMKSAAMARKALVSRQTVWY